MRFAQLTRALHAAEGDESEVRALASQWVRANEEFHDVYLYAAGIAKLAEAPETLAAFPRPGSVVTEARAQLIADPECTGADLYGMTHTNAADTTTVRSVFVIGPDKRVKLTLGCPASTGRDFGEIIRVIDSLQLTARDWVATRRRPAGGRAWT